MRLPQGLNITLDLFIRSRIERKHVCSSIDEIDKNDLIHKSDIILRVGMVPDVACCLMSFRLKMQVYKMTLI